MVISHAHRYVFVALPRTGSIAVERELCALYGGQRILRRHAYYHEFLRVASAEERRYFVFSAVRNPLDEAVSIYFRERSDRCGHYTDPGNRRMHGGNIRDAELARFRWIRESGADFASYFRRFYDLRKLHRFPYDNWSCLDHARFDYVMRFERLEEDFEAVLEKLGLEPQRPLPLANRTDGKAGDFLDHYAPGIRDRAVRVFGPFMLKWGYPLPAEWGAQGVPLACRAHFWLLGALRRLYWRRLGFDTAIARRLEQWLP